MSVDPWSVPSESKPTDTEYAQIGDLVGELLLLTPREYREHIETKFSKDADCVVADVAVINTDKPTESVIHESMWLMQGRLIAKTKAKVGNGMVLGRLVQKPTDRGNPAYDLDDPTEPDKEAARAFYTAKSAPPF